MNVCLFPFQFASCLPQIIRRLKAGRFPLADYDPYGPDSIVDYDNPEEALHPTSYAYPPKRRFLPSLWENKRINQLVKLIREGKIRADPPQPPEVGLVHRRFFSLGFHFWQREKGVVIF